jgi:DNA-binding XRE family transcriptional regulator
MALKEKTRLDQPEHGIAYESLTMALGIIVERIQSLPADDKDDLYKLMLELPKASCAEELESVVVTMREILDQAPVTVRPVEMNDEAPGAGLQKWLDFVSERIRTLRKSAGLTQEELAAKSGLPQSHISRLEAAKHSPTRMTLEKIAQALGVEIGQLDPSA